YGMCASDLNDDRVSPDGPRRLMSAGDVVVWCRHRPEGAPWCLRHFAEERLTGAWRLFRHRNGIRLWAADHVEKLWPGACPEAAAEARGNLAPAADLHTNLGHQSPPATPEFRLDLLKAAGKVSPDFPFLDNYRLDGYLTYLHRLLDWAAQHRVPI